MVKVVKTFENETITMTLTFRGKEFTTTILPWESGKRKSKEKLLSNQVEEFFKEDKNIEEIADIVDNIDFGMDDDIEEALEQLVSFE